ncbi:MAG: TIGR03086 family metal-binding protein [Nocardioidaceae bacterium]
MSYDKSVLVPVDIDTAFQLITQPERLRRWKTVAARVDLRVGGEYRWTVVPGHSAAGSFTEVEPGKRVVFTWGWEGSPDLPPGASTVTVTLEPAEGGTTVRLVHDGLNGAQEASHAEGWNHYLDRLVTEATTGNVGPDPWDAVPADLDELSCAEATLAGMQRVLRGVTDADLDKHTPCTEFTVSKLADHVVDSLTKLGAMAGGSVQAAPPPAATTMEARIADVAQQVLESWRGRGLEGSVPHRESEMPAAIAAGILSVEFLVHGWDFATATDQPFPVSDEVAEYVLGLAQRVISPSSRASGDFADEVSVGPGADALERVIAFTGRKPA